METLFIVFAINEKPESAKFESVGFTNKDEAMEDGRKLASFMYNNCAVEFMDEFFEEWHRLDHYSN